MNQRVAALTYCLLLAACGRETPTSETGGSSASSSSVASAQSSGAADDGDAKGIESEAELANIPPVSETSDDDQDSAAVTASNALPPLKLAVLPSSLPASSSFKEGVHYRRLSPIQPTDSTAGTVEVAEVFWYGCEPCFKIDAKLNVWRTKFKPAYVAFERIPAMEDVVQRFHARVFYAADQLGKIDVLQSSLYSEIQSGKDPLTAMEQLAKFVAAHGVDAREFQKMFASQDVENKLRHADLLVRRYRVDSLPFFVVNGKYTTNIEMAGGEDKLIMLLSELSIREHEF